MKRWISRSGDFKTLSNIITHWKLKTLDISESSDITEHLSVLLCQMFPAADHLPKIKTYLFSCSFRDKCVRKYVGPLWGLRPL